jgi:hypothetical protein
VTVSYLWNKDFRERIIALCLTPGWFGSYGVDIILPEYFDTQDEQTVVSRLIDFFHEYKRIPAKDEAYAIMAEDGDSVEKLLDNIYDCVATGELGFAQDLALQFAKEQAMKLAILASVDDIHAGRLSEPVERVRQAMTVGVGSGDIGIDLKADLEWIYAEAWEEKIPTGIYLCDMLMGGGLGKGELGLLLAATNVGKTQGLVNVGAAAAGLMSRCNVGHLSFELSASKVAKRYGARTVFKWVTNEDPETYAIEFTDRANLVMPGNVYIKEFPTMSASADDVEAWMERMSLMGIRLDMLIVDYPGIMRHTHQGEGWEQLAVTYNQLRSIAMRWNIPVWGAAQGNRASLGKAIVTLKDIAESFKAAGNADVVLAMCQTIAEEEEDRLRLFAAKVRDGDKGWMVRCILDTDSHAIISDEIVTVSQVLDGINPSGAKNTTPLVACEVVRCGGSNSGTSYVEFQNRTPWYGKTWVGDTNLWNL